MTDGQGQVRATVGRVPAPEVLCALGLQLGRAHAEAGFWYSDCLRESSLAALLPEPDFCGLLAASMPVDRASPHWLMLFRPEHPHTRRWAGAPKEPQPASDGGYVLHPKASFDAWLEQVRGHSLPWDGIQRRGALELAEDLTVAASVARVAELNDHLERINDKLRHAAQTDSLTGLWNRYRLEQALDTELAAAERYQRPCSLVIFDVDHFKHYNDTHGHQAGDEVLKAIAACAAAGLRSTDFIGRWGGEEFVVLAANTRLEEGTQLAERLREAVAALDLGELGGVTISLGVSSYRPGDNRRSLLARADEALYEAKHRGRDRVVPLG